MNPRPLPCQGSALPLRHSPPLCYPLVTVNAGYTAAVNLFHCSFSGTTSAALPAGFHPGRLSGYELLPTASHHQLFCSTLLQSTSDTFYIICTPYTLVNSSTNFFSLLWLSGKIHRIACQLLTLCFQAKQFQGQLKP